MMYNYNTGHVLVLLEDADGRCQVRDYLRSQSKRVRSHAGWLLQVLERQGDKLDRPAAGHLGGGIYELRIIVERQQHRILFFYDRRFIVATNAFLKKTDRVPEAEIAKAEKARLEWESQGGSA